ncbi:MAG: toprim domain-containing protein [Caldilineaceae bacterium]|nr:toprim domain-containing protein [Caldilineaceae bacterium]
MITRIDTEKLLASVDLLDVVAADLGPAQRCSGQWHFWCCPFHGERTPSFGVNPETRSWRCYGACHKSGNAIDYVMRYKEIEFLDACNYLAKFAGELPTMDGTTTTPARPKVFIKPPDAEVSTWQERAHHLTQECHSRLFDNTNPASVNVLRWLHQRGLTIETIQSARLGHSVQQLDSRDLWGLPNDGYQDKVSLLPGVLIPWYENGIIKRVIIRRYPLEEIEGINPYKVLPGSANLLYNLDRVDTSRPVVLVEGVFDALSIQQEAGDLVHAVATGGTGGAHTQETIEKLSATPLVLVSFDNDKAGDDGSSFWTISLPNAKRWRPIIFKDPSEMLEQGFPLRKWIETGLKSKR